MANKIFKGIGGLLGVGKKKKKVEAPKEGPIIKALNPAEKKAIDPRQRFNRTILEDRLGSRETLGG